MSSNLKAECKQGVACQFLKAGTCKFSHPKVKAIPPKKKATVMRNVKLKDVLRHSSHVQKAMRDLARAKVMQREYVMPGNKDVKGGAPTPADTEVADLEAQVQALRNAARAAIGGSKIKVKLFFRNTITGGAGAAIAGFYGLIPSSSAEWTSLIALYDEVRVDAVIMRHIAGVSSGPSVPGLACVNPYAIGYDPTYNTIPTSLEDVQESDVSEIKLMPASATFNIGSCPLGFHELRWKIPHDGAVLNSDMKTTPNFPGSWMSCLDPTDSVGYIRYYAPALGGTGVMDWRQHAEVHCEFRVRT
jgi:hypothetical protein